MKTEYDLVSERLRNIDSKAIWEFVPHVIPVEINVDMQGITSIPVHDEAPHGFLLERINARYLTQTLRIRQNNKQYYSAPGWLHYIHHDVELKPALFMQDFGWFLDVSFSWYLQTDIKTLQFALIGQRVIKL